MNAHEFIEATLRRLGAESQRAYPAETKAREIEEQARCAGLREAVALVQAWLCDPQDPPEELLHRVRELALAATEQQRADRRDPEREGVRRGWWRATFLLAQALGLDPFGRTREQLAEQVTAGEWPWAPRERRGQERPPCAGLRKDGASCGGWPLHGSHFCRHHQGQGIEPVGPTPPAKVMPWDLEEETEGPASAGSEPPEVLDQELDPEAAFDAKVEVWLKEAGAESRAAGE